MNYFEDKKPILVFVFFLNILIMIVMGIVIFNDELAISESIVDLCTYVMLVNIIINGIYILIILLFIIRKIVEWINIVLDKGIDQQIESRENRKLKFFDRIKDPVIIFSVLFLGFAILTVVLYFMMSPMHLTIISFGLAIVMGILFLICTKKEMVMVFRVFLIFFIIFLVYFILRILWDNINW